MTLPVHDLALFVGAALLLNLTPGPDMLFVAGTGAARGRAAGLMAALGVGAGCLFHTLLAALGLTALLAASELAFNAVKWAGAAYLVWTGVQMLRARPAAATAEAPARRSGSPFWQGALTNALNPKVALFFLAFLPQFIGPAVEHKALAFLLLGLLFNFNGLWVNVGWALAAAWLASRATTLQKGMHWLDRIAGAMFVGFGLKLALSDNPDS